MLTDWPVSDDVRVACAPEATYRALVEDADTTSTAGVLGHAALANAVLVFGMPLIVTGRITFVSLTSSVLCWGFVAVLQTILGWALIVSSPSRRVGVRRALDLWFAAHLPFSLWMLVVFGWVMYTNGLAQLSILATATVPAVWTMVLIWSYCRAVLGVSQRAAAWRVALEQAAAWLLVTAYVLFAAGGLGSIIRFLVRQFES
jgi:hypothetical protein